MLVCEPLSAGSLQFAIALATQKTLVMTVCVSIRRQPFNTHGHGHEHEVWTQNLPTLPCHWPQDMKFPWKNVTAVPAISSFATSPAPGAGQNTGTPAWLRGRRQHPGCSGRREEGAPLLQSGAMSRALQRFFLPRSRRSAGSLSDAMGRCGAAAARASPTSENPSFHHYRLSVRPSATAGTAQHSTARLFSLESPAFGYLHPFLRERQEAK